MRWLTHIFFLLVALAVVYPFGLRCSDVVCGSSREVVKVSAHLCCDPDNLANPATAHDPIGNPHGAHCSACTIKALPSVVQSFVVPDLSLPSHPLLPVLWVASIERASFEVSESSVGPRPPTLLALHVMLTC